MRYGSESGNSQSVYQRVQIGLELGVDASGVVWRYVSDYVLYTPTFNPEVCFSCSDVPEDVIFADMPGKARNAPCPCCGRHAPVAACDFDAIVTDSRDKCLYRNMFIVCARCSKVSTLAEAAYIGSQWFGMSWDRTPAVPVLPAE